MIANKQELINTYCKQYNVLKDNLMNCELTNCKFIEYLNNLPKINAELNTIVEELIRYYSVF